MIQTGIHTLYNIYAFCYNIMLSKKISSFLLEAFFSRIIMIRMKSCHLIVIQENLSVCLQNLYSALNLYIYIIRLYRLLERDGSSIMNHFYLYNESSDPMQSCVLHRLYRSFFIVCATSEQLIIVLVYNNNAAQRWRKQVYFTLAYN